MEMKNLRLWAIVLVVAILLLIPYIAMKFTDEVKWGVFDFIIAAVLLLGAGLTCGFVLRKVRKMQHRLAICAGILLLLFLIWVELAVGIIGTPIAGS